MSQPLLSHLDLWSRHERRVLEVLVDALSLLQTEADLERSEVVLNRKLYFCLLNANRRRWQESRDGFDHPPVWEGKNSPDLDDERPAKRENKIPDFCWSIIDHAAEDPRRGAHYFVIECKRLGSPSRADWILNENYIQHGVLRFVRPEYGYAKNEASAAMVGYIESMEPDDILADVNTAALSAAIGAIARPNAGWQVDGVSRIVHQVTRLSPEPVLTLRHVWVDLRSCFGPSLSRS